MTRYVCNFVLMYIIYIETKHENRDRLVETTVPKFSAHISVIIIRFLVSTKSLLFKSKR